MARIDGDVTRAGLEDAEDGDDHVEGGVEQECDPVFRADAASDERVGELIAAGVQRRVGHGFVAQGQGDGVGHGRGLAGEPLGQMAPILVRLAFCSGRDVTPGEKLRLRGLIHQIEATDGGVGAGDDVRQQGAIGPQHGSGRALSQDIRVVLQGERQVFIPLSHHERYIKLGDPAFEGDGLQGQARHIHIAAAFMQDEGPRGFAVEEGGGFLPGEEGLENGIAGRIAGGMQCLHQQWKGELVIHSLLQALIQLVQNVDEGAVGVQTGAQRHGVDKIADNPGKGGGAPGPQHARDQIILPGVAIQQHMKSGQQEIMEGNAALAGQLPQRRGQISVHRGQGHASRMALSGRTGEVGGEIEGGRQGRELLAPEVELGAGLGRRQTLGLGFDKITIRAPQFGHAGAAAAANLGQKLSPFVGDEGQGPQIGDNVVHGQRKRVALRAQNPDVGPQQRAARHIERLQGSLLDSLLQCILIPGCGIGDAQMHRQMFMDMLNRFAVGPAGEGGSQGFMPGDDLIQGLFQSPRIQRVPDDHGLIDGVGHVVGVQLLQEPERALSRREGKFGVDGGHLRKCGHCPISPIRPADRQGNLLRKKLWLHQPRRPEPANMQ